MSDILDIALPLCGQALLSAYRLLIGHTAGYLIGICLSLAAFHVKGIRRVAVSCLSLAAPIPIIAWLPLVITCFGIEEAAKIVCVGVPTAILIFFFSLHGFDAVEQKYLQLAKLGQVSEYVLVAYILLPSSARIRGIGQRLALFVGWFALVIVERALGDIQYGGIGYAILKHNDLGQKSEMWSGCVVLAIAACILDAAIAYIHRRQERWRER